VSAAEAANFLPIWSCSVWGLPCPRHYWRGGALLPHLFTLTPLPGRYVLCGTLRPSGLNLTSRTLSGTLLCGVRTFLPSRPETRRAAVRSGCLQLDYTTWVRDVSALASENKVPLPFVRLGTRTDKLKVSWIPSFGSQSKADSIKPDSDHEHR